MVNLELPISKELFTNENTTAKTIEYNSYTNLPVGTKLSILNIDGITLEKIGVIKSVTSSLFTINYVVNNQQDHH